MEAKKFEVTLAKKVDDYELFTDVKQYFIQPKLDGVRCYINKDGAFSRNHKPIKNVQHILDELKPFFKYAPEFTLDGELYNHQLKEDFNKIISLVRKTVDISDEAREESKRMIQFHCYDLFDEKHPLETYHMRRDQIHHIVKYKYKLLYTRTVDTKVVTSQDEIDVQHTLNLHDGYEGSMLRKNEAYQQRRSPGLLKVKDWHDSEFIIEDFIEGKGKFTGGLGKFIGRDSEGTRVEVPFPTVTIEKRREIWENREFYRGQLATFEWFERTKAGAYRFPRFKALRNYE